MFLIDKIKRAVFPFYREKNIRKIFKILNDKNEKNAMFVGGCVRKHLSNEKIDDIDIATILTPSEVIKKFSNSDFEVKETGIEHGTLTLVKDGRSFEITTLREDISTDGRHAKVSFTRDWKKDSERRDFTINAIYLSEKGLVFDPQNGVSDLKNNQVKFIGDPTRRIQEDYLRILRYIRFTLQYNCQTDEETIKTIKINLAGFNNLSKERVYSELLKILSLENFQNKILARTYLKEIFSLIFPEFKYLYRLKKKKEFFSNKLSAERLLTMLILDESNNHEYFCYKYKASNKLKDKFKFLSKGLIEIKKDKNFFKDNINKNLYLFGKDLMVDLNYLSYFENKKKDLQNFISTMSTLNKVSIPKFPYDGKFLISKGFPEGKKIGKVLKEIEKKWIENQFHLKDTEINNLLKKHI